MEETRPEAVIFLHAHRLWALKGTIMVNPWHSTRRFPRH